MVGDVDRRAAEHQMRRALLVDQAVKAGQGKGEIAMKSVTLGEKISPVPRHECKMCEPASDAQWGP